MWLQLINPQLLLMLASATSLHQQKLINLILAKCTHIEIYRFDGEGLETILDVPIYGRIATLETFRHHNETMDRLFVATEECKYFFLQWDPVNSKSVTREMGDITKPNWGCHTNAQIGIVDPKCRLIILHSSDGLFKVIHFDDSGCLNQTFDTRLWVYKVLDIKFLLDCSDPTIAVLYQVSLADKCFVEGSFSQTDLQYGVHLLIPVPPPLGGLVTIGCENIAYYNKTIPIELVVDCRVSITRAYGIVDTDGARYLLGDHGGILRLLVLTHEQEKVTGLKIEHLGETSIPSTISYLDNEIVYIGSRYGDSQVIKVNLQHDTKREQLEVLKRFGNLGPIRDFCIVDPEPERQGLGGMVLTCSGAYKDSSLRIVYKALGINVQASVKCEGIKGLWSLKSSTDDRFDQFLAVTFVNTTRFFALNAGVLQEETIEGFCSEEVSLFCHGAIHNQLVQITSRSVRLVSSLNKDSRCYWSAPSGSSCGVATANTTQILLATTSRESSELVYLEIGDGVLYEKKKIKLDCLEIGDRAPYVNKLECLISCLDIHSISNSSNRSHLAAVGLWDRSVAIYSLPNLARLTNVHLDLAPDIISRSESLGVPRSVLLRAFEGIPYLLCGLSSGNLLYFLLNESTGGLTDKKVISPGEAPITALRTSSSNVLAVSLDRPILINSSGKNLVFSNINLRELTDMCPFNPHAFPESYAMASLDDLVIGTMDERRKLHILRSIPLGEDARCICRQVKTKTYAICTAKSKPCAEESQLHLGDFESGYVRLLDDGTFAIQASFPLQTGEHGRCIVSCSIVNDKKEYYCVGTAYVFHHQNESYKGRILVFSVGDKDFKLIAETEIKGAVYCLKGFQEKLLAAVGRNIQLYKWVQGDGTCVLQMECSHSCDILALCMETRENSIVVGDLRSILLLTYRYKDGKGVIEEEQRRDSRNSVWMSAIAILTDDAYLGATLDFNLLHVKSCDVSHYLSINGEYYHGGCINQFRHGMVPWSEAEMTQCVTFGTSEGVIGVVAALSKKDYIFLRKIQHILSNMIGNGVGVPLDCEWRGFGCMREMSTEFLDGDLIESFIGLDCSQKEDISSKVGVSVEELCDKIEKLRRLH